MGIISKFLEFIKSKQSEIVLTVAVILITTISFQSGKIFALKNFNKPLVIKDPPTAISSNKKSQSTNLTTNSKIDSQIIASKNSTVYHFSWCSGAQRIKAENKIVFASEQEAQSRGYSLASNCKK